MNQLKEKSCCGKDIKNGKNSKGKGFLQGLIYGLIPHSFCILFIVLSAFGAVTGAVFFSKFLLIPYFFQFLILLSLVFATISAVIYLKRNGDLSFKGAAKRWKYLATLYGVTISVNFLFFFWVFPAVANTNFNRISVVENKAVQEKTNSFSQLNLEVDIPCSGHAPLIISELEKIIGINDVEFEAPKLFKVFYDGQKTSPLAIISSDIFKTFKAVIK